MARGWESKSVEEQMASAVQEPLVAPDNGFVSEETKRLAEQVRTDRAREIQALNLQRTSNPARRTALEAALAQIEKQIANFA
jgi:hypothetical protein